MAQRVRLMGYLFEYNPQSVSEYEAEEMLEKLQQLLDRGYTLQIDEEQPGGRWLTSIEEVEDESNRYEGASIATSVWRIDTKGAGAERNAVGELQNLGAVESDGLWYLPGPAWYPVFRPTERAIAKDFPNDRYPIAYQALLRYANSNEDDVEAVAEAIGEQVAHIWFENAPFAIEEGTTRQEFRQAMSRGQVGYSGDLDFLREALKLIGQEDMEEEVFSNYFRSVLDEMFDIMPAGDPDEND